MTCHGVPTKILFCGEKKNLNDLILNLQEININKINKMLSSELYKCNIFIVLEVFMDYLNSLTFYKFEGDGNLGL